MGVIAASAPLPGFLNSLSGPLDHYGYWAIALLLLLENIGIPVVPGEFALIGGAIFAGTGRAGLNVVVVGIVAVVAAVTGAEIGYLIGKYAGFELVLRYGKYVLIKPHHLTRTEATVARYGGIVVIVARFIVVLRELNGIISGITQMRWATFLFFNVVGACAWVATWLTIGYVAGDHIGAIYSGINRFALYVLVVVAVLLVAYIARRLIRRRRAARLAAEAAETNDAPGIVEAEGTGDGQSSGESQSSGAGQSPAEPHSSGEGQGSGEAEASGEGQGSGEAEACGEGQGSGEAQGLTRTQGSGEGQRSREARGSEEDTRAAEESGAQEQPRTRTTEPKSS